MTLAMPAYRFSWTAFDDRTVTSLALSLGYYPTRHAASTMREYLTKRVARPNADSFGDARDALVNSWLTEYRGLDAFVDRLIEAGLGPGGRPRSTNGYLDFVRKTRNSKRFRQFLLEALLRFGDQDRAGPDEGVADSVRRFVTLAPGKQAQDDRKPHSCWAASRTLAPTVGSGLCLVRTGSATRVLTIDVDEAYVRTLHRECPGDTPKVEGVQDASIH